MRLPLIVADSVRPSGRTFPMDVVKKIAEQISLGKDLVIDVAADQDPLVVNPERVVGHITNPFIDEELLTVELDLLESSILYPTIEKAISNVTNYDSVLILSLRGVVYSGHPVVTDFDYICATLRLLEPEED